MDDRMIGWIDGWMDGWMDGLERMLRRIFSTVYTRGYKKLLVTSSSLLVNDGNGHETVSSACVCGWNK